MADAFSQHTTHKPDPADTAWAVTPDDDNDLTEPCRFLRVAGAGDLAVTTIDGDDVTLVDVLAGEYIWLRVRRVLETGTDATGIVAFR